MLIGFLASDGMPNKVNGLSTAAGWTSVAAGRGRGRGDGVFVHGRIIIAFAIKKTMGIRVAPEDEESGIYAMRHGDAAYELQPA